MKNPAPTTPAIDEILDKYRRWIIESCAPCNSFNEATKLGFTKQAKKELNQFYAEEMLRCLPKKKPYIVSTHQTVRGQLEIMQRQYQEIGFNEAIAELRTAITNRLLGNER